MSRPTRSSSSSGPIGKLQPPFIAASMSSRVATPASNRRTALLRYGNSNAFTMNPAWSFTCTAFFPHAVAKAVASATVSSDDVIARTISTSAIIGAGLKKWTPQTLSGRPVTIAISTTGRVEVLVARIVCSGQIRSRSVKRCFFVGEVLDDRLEHEVALGELARDRRPRAPGRGPRRDRWLRACPARPASRATSPAPRPLRRRSVARGCAARPRTRSWRRPRRCPNP